MSIKDQPSVKHLEKQMSSYGMLIRINKILRSIGLGSKQIADIEPQLQQLQQQYSKHIEYLDKFNRYFSDEGWLAHDSINSDVLKKAVDAYEEQAKERAIEILLEHYGVEQVAGRVSFFYQVEELRTRRKFIEFALTENRAGRHYSAIPLLLMIIDGAVNDAVGKGFHAANLSLGVWDSFLTADGAIYKIQGIFQKGRKKTRSEMAPIVKTHFFSPSVKVVMLPRTTG